MYGHIQTLAAAEKQGIEDAGGSVDVYQYDPPSLDRHPLLSSCRLIFDFSSE